MAIRISINEQSYNYATNFNRGKKLSVSLLHNLSSKKNDDESLLISAIHNSSYTEIFSNNEKTAIKESGSYNYKHNINKNHVFSLVY